MKASIRNLVIGAVMAVGVFAASSAALAGNMQYVQNGMNFRSGASTSAATIGSVPAGAQVEVLGMENGWNLIRYNGTVGCIHGGNLADTYVVKQAAPQQSASQATYGTTQSYFNNNWSQTAQNMNASAGAWKTVYVTEGFLALRTAPDYNAGNVIGQLYTGDSVQLIGGSTSGSYVQVYSPKFGTSGWVNAGFLG